MTTLTHHIRASMNNVQLVWMVHFLITIVILLFGIYRNREGRKYLLADTSEIECQKAYFNVYSSSSSDDKALVCCDNLAEYGSGIMKTYENGLCQKNPYHLPFAGILTSFHGAWVIPLIPILFRILYGFIRYHRSRGILEFSTETWTNVKRLGCYIVIMNVRGWILYICLNKVEEAIITTLGWTNYSHLHDSCWYQELLRGRKKNHNCYGQSFEFSDHIVLFYAHILPIVLFETLFWFTVPIWSRDSSTSLRANLLPITWIEKVSSMILIMISIYIYFITFQAVIKTSTYFHTSLEMIVGYIISLSVQMPLAYVMCSGHFDRWRGFIGLSPSRECMD